MDLEKMGLQDSEIDRFLQLFEVMKSSQNLNLLSSNKMRKMLVLKFVSGPLDKEIILDPEEMPIIFGK